MFIVSFVAHLGGKINRGKIVNTVCQKSVKLLKGILKTVISILLMVVLCCPQKECASVRVYTCDKYLKRMGLNRNIWGRFINFLISKYSKKLGFNCVCGDRDTYICVYGNLYLLLKGHSFFLLPWFIALIRKKCLITTSIASSLLKRGENHCL